MDNSVAQDRSMVNVGDHTPTAITRNGYNEIDRTRTRLATSSGTSRHRVGASPVRVKRPLNESVPTAVVTPTPPTRESVQLSQKMNQEYYENRYVSFSGEHTAFCPSSSECIATNGTSLSPAMGGLVPRGGANPALGRRSRSSIGSIGAGVLPKKLEYDDDEAASPQWQYGNWLGDDLGAERQAPSNSILTLHLSGGNRASSPILRDESQERRLRELEERLLEIESRLSNSGNNGDGAKGVQSPAVKNYVQPAIHSGQIIQSTPKSRSTGNKASGDYGVVSVSVPPVIAVDSGLFRVQPASRSEAKVQREVERLEKKLKQHEEAAEILRSQHYKQIEQLTRQLASNDDAMQTLRSRIRELELENELWQNRFRLYNDVDVAKILRENERLRSIQRRRTDSEEKKGTNDTHKYEQLQQDLAKVLARYGELENKYRTMKEKHKETVKNYRTRARQDHIEVEALKVTVDLQNTELSELRKRVLNQVSTTEEPPAATTEKVGNAEQTNCHLRKCSGIAACLANICTRIKRNEPLDPEEVLNYSSDASAFYNRRDQKSITTDCDKSIEENAEQLSRKLVQLHSMVIDIYGDDLANSVSCNVQ